MGGCENEEEHLMADRAHRVIPIPPKHFVAQVVGCIREERNPYCRDGHGQATELLGARIFCFDNRPRRSYGSGIHKKAGIGGGWIGCKYFNKPQ